MARGKHRTDIVSVVEAAYRPGESLRGWTDQLVRAVRPHLGHGYGAQVAVYPWDNPQLLASTVSVDGGPPGLEHYVRTLNTGVSPDESGGFLTRAPANCMYTWQQVAPEGTGPDVFRQRPLGDVQFVDWLAVLVREPGVSVLAGAMADRRIELSEADRRRWRLLGVHIGAGLRLQLNVSQAPEAILEPDGACAHAEGRARPRGAREALRTAARRIDRARSTLRRTDEMGALRLWQGLVEGRWSLVDRFDSDGRRSLLALRNEPNYPDPRALTPRERQVANLAADGQSNLEIAYALGLSESTASTHLSAVMRKLKVGRREELLALLRPLDGRTSTAEIGEQTVAVASSELTAGLQVPGLSAAEREVVAGVVEGLTNQQIAARRRVSPRTVANQLRSVFRKLKVQSRAELLLAVQTLDC